MEQQFSPAAIAAAQQIVMASWAASQQPGFKAVSSTPRSGGYAHGNGGLMAAPGMSREIVNAMLLPYTGLASRLASFPSNEQNPLFGIITGQTAGSGSNPTGVCDDPPMAGLLKLCTSSFVFGRYSLQTPVVDIDRVGLTTNRGEFYDYTMYGNPFGPNGQNPIGPSSTPSLQDALNNEVAKVMFELAVDWTRRYGSLLYTGNPSNNTSGGGYKEFRGLDGLINTGWRDAETQQLCPAADSIVANFASMNVTTQATNIVPLLTSVLRRLKLNARNMGLWPAKWVLVMRESLFYELTQIWACSYATYRCQTQGGFSTSQVNQIDNRDVMKLRQDMRGNMLERTGQYLLVDDEQWEVVFDDFIPETALANGAFNSSIYVVPMTVIGGRNVTYFEYVNYRRPGGSLDAARALAPTDTFFETDQGRFMWHKKPPTNFCVQALVKSEPRLIFRAPHLAARIIGVAYTPLAHERDWATTGYYHVDGGLTGQTIGQPSFWSPNASLG